MSIDPGRSAVPALHWQVDVIKLEGFFGPMLKLSGLAGNDLISWLVQGGIDIVTAQVFGQLYR